MLLLSMLLLLPLLLLLLPLEAPPKTLFGSVRFVRSTRAVGSGG